MLLELVTISTKSHMISVTNCLIIDLETAQNLTHVALYTVSSFQNLDTLFPGLN